MTVKELSQLYYLNKEIERLSAALSKLERNNKQVVLTDCVKASMKQYPYTEYSMKISGISNVAFKYGKHNTKINRLKNEIEKKVDISIQERLRLEEYINSIEEAEIRHIFALRYVDGMPWAKIAEALGSKGDGSTERKKHDRYLKVS